MGSTLKIIEKWLEEFSVGEIVRAIFFDENISLTSFWHVMCCLKSVQAVYQYAEMIMKFFDRLLIA